MFGQWSEAEVQQKRSLEHHQSLHLLAETRRMPTSGVAC